MDYDLSESIPQGFDGTQEAENRRIEEIAHQLQRLRGIYEAECEAGGKHVTTQDAEIHCAEQLAKELGLWTPFELIFELGLPGPNGHENETFVTDTYIYKVNNLMNCGNILALLEKILVHNHLFPDTAYSLHGFTGFEGRSVYPIIRQERICNARPATQVMIDTYMSALGFEKTNREGHYTNGTYEAWDLLPRNVLVDEEGDLYVVDAEIRCK